MRQSCFSTRICRYEKLYQSSPALAWKMSLTRVLNDQEINIQNMNVELVAQMFKNYRSNVLFHLEGPLIFHHCGARPDYGLQQPIAFTTHRSQF